MGRIRVGCQAYTWQMSGRYVGQLGHILDTVQAAGFTGFELETCMLGHFYDDPARTHAELRARAITLAAVCLVLPWTQSRETDAERAESERLLRFLHHWPDALLILVQSPGHDRSDLRERQRNALACLNSVSARAHDRGIACAYHPNSPPGSLFRTADDYRVLVDGLDDRTIGLAPDAGHIAKGGMDVLTTFQQYRPLIRHVHFKDMDATGAWMAMGAGAIDFPALVALLRQTDYAGWIMVEEESAQAEAEPDAVTLANGRYFREVLLPLLV